MFGNPGTFGAAMSFVHKSLGQNWSEISARVLEDLLPRQAPPPEGSPKRRGARSVMRFPGGEVVRRTSASFKTIRKQAKSLQDRKCKISYGWER